MQRAFLSNPFQMTSTPARAPDARPASPAATPPAVPVESAVDLKSLLALSEKEYQGVRQKAQGTNNIEDYLGVFSEAASREKRQYGDGPGSDWIPPEPTPKATPRYKKYTHHHQQQQQQQKPPRTPRPAELHGQISKDDRTGECHLTRIVWGSNFPQLQDDAIHRIPVPCPDQEKKVPEGTPRPRERNRHPWPYAGWPR